MIVSSCPLRVSLVGGSTDHPHFIAKYGRGSVISFPSNLRTYITIHQDVFGSNSIDHKYNIMYSKREQVDRIEDIQNELVRHCFDYLKVEQINCSFASDIQSAGSGLAASSSYLQALIKAIYVMREKHISEFEICKIAEQIEKKFNPLVGQQDFYGSMGGFKKINFYKDKDPEITYLSTKIFDDMDISLLYTGVIRNSSNILETIDIFKVSSLLNDVKNLETAILNNDIDLFNSVIRQGWQHKKETSNLICSNPILNELDSKLTNNINVLSHKLCGAGGGGFFLIFSKKGYKFSEFDYLKQIQISETGLKFINLKNEFTRV